MRNSKREEMYLVCGLGNIGSKYAGTRHNFGFMAIDSIVQQLISDHTPFKKDESGTKYVLKIVEIVGNDVILMKALGYMNESGRPIREVAEKYEVSPQNIIVIHDEMDLPLGRIGIKFGGGSGGHNGLRSIASELGTQDHIRIRGGIGRPLGSKPAHDHVLGEISPKEMHQLAPAIAEVKDIVDEIVMHGVDSAMNIYNRKDLPQS